VQEAIGEKVAFNAALNSICAVTGCSVDQLAAVADGQALAFEVVDEVLAVAQAMGIAASPEACKAHVADAIARHAGHKPSMLQDLLAGRRTEIETLNGAVVAAADERSIAVPGTRVLLRLVRLAQARPAAAPVARSASAH
jgi:2-dehydropantoate 2-reductase